MILYIDQCFKIVFTALVLIGLTGSASCYSMPAQCPYLIKEGGDSYYDYSSMYHDADLAVIAHIESVPAKSVRTGLMTLAIETVIKGDKSTKTLLINYDHGLCGSEICSSDIISPTTRSYLFFLKNTTASTAERIVCPNQTSNGWVNHGDVYFAQGYSTPLANLKNFLESNKAVVQAP